MDQKSSTNSNNTDDELAAFTDQLWSNKGTQDKPTPSPNPESEVEQLKESVDHIYRTLGPAEPPSPELRQRIRQSLVKAWQQEHSRRPLAAKTAPPPNWQQRVETFLHRFGLGWQSQQRRRRTLAFGLSFAGIALVVWLALLTPSDTPGVATTTGGSAGITILILSLAAILLVLFWWSGRSKK